MRPPPPPRVVYLRSYDRYAEVLRYDCGTARFQAAMLHYFLIHQGEGYFVPTVSLHDRKRSGIGTNPYDNMEEDVDLFAMMVAGMKREEFFRNYTRP